MRTHTNISPYCFYILGIIVRTILRGGGVILNLVGDKKYKIWFGEDKKLEQVNKIKQVLLTYNSTYKIICIQRVEIPKQY